MASNGSTARRQDSGDGRTITSGTRTRRLGWRTAAILFASFALVISACGGDGGTSSSGGPKDTARGGDEDAEPQYGGRLVYGLAAENADGWCLTGAQLAPPGIQVARSIYDTLTIPDEKGELVPFLAESLTPNDDFTVWDIDLREGIKFHDGTDMDAEVVKNNIDAYRGEYPGRISLLFSFVYDNIADVQVTGPLSIRVTTHSPWSSLPQALWSTGRTGIMAQAQLDDPDTCDSKLIGTGPFRLVEWARNERMVLERNPDYWQKDQSGNALPYLDELEYRPMPDGSARTNALLSGELDAISTASAQEMEALDDAENSGDVTNTTSDDFPTVSFIQFNNAKAPFDDKDARLAVIKAIDMDAFNTTINLNSVPTANGPFAPDNIGHLADTGYPTFDLDAAKAHVEAYRNTTGNALAFSIIGPPDQNSLSMMTVIQKMAEQAGIKVTITQMETAAMVSTSVSGKYDAMIFANYPGGDPDDNRVWWYGGSPVNLSRFDDSEINRLLDAGRSTADPAERQDIYAGINRRFASEGYSAWLNWTITQVGTGSAVHGVFGPDLPDGGAPSRALVNGHSTAGMWIDR